MNHSQKTPAEKNVNKRTAIAGSMGLFFLFMPPASWSANVLSDLLVLEGETLSAAFDDASSPTNENQAAQLKQAQQDAAHAISSLETSHFLLHGSDIWIASIGTLLFTDRDRDGYFSSFSLTIDADTRYSHAEVFANIDVLLPDGTREHLHSTATFDIYGNAFSDEYRVDIDLLQNYPIGEYDLHVELVDAYTSRVVDQLGARDLSNLSRLPLESASDDEVLLVDPAIEFVDDSPARSDIRVVEHAGSTGVWTLFGLLMATLLMRRRKP